MINFFNLVCACGVAVLGGIKLSISNHKNAVSYSGATDSDNGGAYFDVSYTLRDLYGTNFNNAHYTIGCIWGDSRTGNVVYQNDFFTTSNEPSLYNTFWRFVDNVDLNQEFSWVMFPVVYGSTSVEPGYLKLNLCIYTFVSFYCVNNVSLIDNPVYNIKPLTSTYVVNYPYVDINDDSIKDYETALDDDLFSDFYTCFDYQIGFLSEFTGYVETTATSPYDDYRLSWSMYPLSFELRINNSGYYFRDEVIDVPLSFRFTTKNNPNLTNDKGYADGYEDGEKQGYNDGHYDGYEEGYDEGFNDGDAVGYNNGYHDGLSSGSNYTFWSLFGAIADTPALMIRSLFDFDFFGVNLLSVVLSMFTAIVLFYIFRKII